MAFSNPANPANALLQGSTHGGSQEVPCLSKETMCCQYRTFIFFSKDSEEVIFGHTSDCNIPISLMGHEKTRFFPIYANGPFEGSVPVVETTPNPPIIRRTPKWTDDGKPILWFVNFKNIENLLHPLALKKYEQKKRDVKDAEGRNNEKDDKAGDEEQQYLHKSTRAHGSQVSLENEKQTEGGKKKSGHGELLNGDVEDGTGSGSQLRRMNKGEDELPSLGICPYHGEDNGEVDDPDYYDRQQRHTELDHLAMDSVTALVARPLPSYDQYSPRDARHQMRSYSRPLNAGNYRPQRVELHHENRNPNAITAQQNRDIRVGPLTTGAHDISEDGQTVIFRDRDSRCVKYMVRTYGQPLEPGPFRYQLIHERHDPNLQRKQAKDLGPDKDIKSMGLRGGASQARAAEEKYKKEVSMELEMMSGGYDAPVFATVYENNPKEKPKEPSAPDASTSSEKFTDNNNGQSTFMSRRGGGLNGCDERSEASADTGDESESTSLSEAFDRAKKIKTRFEDSGFKTGRPQLAEENKRLRVASFIEAFQNPFQNAGPSSSTGRASCVDLTNQRLQRWEDKALEKTIKEMQREYNRTDTSSDKIAEVKGEIERREATVIMKERALYEQKLLLEDPKDSFKLGLPTQGGQSTDLRTEDSQYNKKTSRIHPTSRGNCFIPQNDLPTKEISQEKLNMLLQVLQDWKQASARLQKDVDDLNDELSTERERIEIYTDKWIYSESQVVRLEKENTEVRRQLQLRDEILQQRMTFPQQRYPPPFFGPPTSWVPDSINQQYACEAASKRQHNAFGRNFSLPDPLNHSFLYQGFPAQAQYGEIGSQPTQPFSHVQSKLCSADICGL